MGFDFEAAFGCPVKVINDAAMQALGSYAGGKMLFLGLGTGLGSADESSTASSSPMELGHLPYRKGTYEELTSGLRGLDRTPRSRRSGAAAWPMSSIGSARRSEPDYVVLGGGNAAKLKALPRIAGRQQRQRLSGRIPPARMRLVRLDSKPPNIATVAH